MSAELVTLHEHSLHDVSAHLRKLADKIEAGEYGEVGCCAISMLADKLNVFSYGPDSAGPATACTLHAGFLYLQTAFLEHDE